MKIIRAEHLGMCFGVRDAIALAREHSTSKPLTVLGDLVHNESVLSDLRQRGIRIEHQLPQVETTTVMITAHGASAGTIERVRQRGHEVIEATCPLVHFAHRSLFKLVEQGYHTVIIGKPDHVEVRGMTGDLREFDVVLDAGDVARIKRRERFGVVSQTTQPIEKVQSLLSVLRATFPASEVRFIDTVCQPTKQRQSSAFELAKASDVVIVIGGANSNNTRELVATCKRFCHRVHHVQTAADVKPEWLDEAEVVGITAGTSTPDFIIDAVEQRLQQLANSKVAVAFH